MKFRNYLNCRVTRQDGTQFLNHLTLKESFLITKLAKLNKSVKVEFKTMSSEEYFLTFNQ